jgi:hypothetical protein
MVIVFYCTIFIYFEHNLIIESVHKHINGGENDWDGEEEAVHVPIDGPAEDLSAIYRPGRDQDVNIS